jgi:hypothetical protein
MDANSIFRIAVGITMLVGGLGYSGLIVLNAMTPDSDPNVGFPLLLGLAIAILGVAALALPLFVH